MQREDRLKTSKVGLFIKTSHLRQTLTNRFRESDLTRYYCVTLNQEHCNETGKSITKEGLFQLIPGAKPQER
jgi:hypothetical protein